MSKKIFALCLFLSAGCVYGPRVEHKSPLNVLNGENYQSTAGGETNQFVIPVAERKDRLTHIKGKIALIEGITEVPLKFVRVGLFTAGGKSLSEVSSDGQGEFTFATALKNGEYVLRSVSPKYRGETKLDVQAYEIEGVVLRAEAAEN